MSGPPPPWTTATAQPAAPTGGRRVGLWLACLGLALAVAVVWPVVAGLGPVRSVVYRSPWVASFLYAAAGSVVLGAALVASLLTRVPLGGATVATLGSGLLSLVGFVVFLATSQVDLGVGGVVRQLLDSVVWGLLCGVAFLGLDLVRRHLPALTVPLGALVGAVAGFMTAVLTLAYIVLVNRDLQLLVLRYDLFQDVVKVALLTATGAACGALATGRARPLPPR